MRASRRKRSRAVLLDQPRADEPEPLRITVRLLGAKPAAPNSHESDEDFSSADMAYTQAQFDDATIQEFLRGRTRELKPVIDPQPSRQAPITISSGDQDVDEIGGSGRYTRSCSHSKPASWPYHAVAPWHPLADMVDGRCRGLRCWIRNNGRGCAPSRRRHQRGRAQCCHRRTRPGRLAGQTFGGEIPVPSTGNVTLDKIIQRPLNALVEAWPENAGPASTVTGRVLREA